MSASACGPKGIFDIPPELMCFKVNRLWLDTYYWNFIYDFEKVLVNDYKEIGLEPSDKERIKEVLGDVDFFFKIQKTSNTEFSFSMRRVFANQRDKRDKGVALEVILSLLHYRESPKRKLMDDIDMVSMTCNIKNMTNPQLHSWVARCTVYLCEETVLDTEVRRKQEALIKALVDKNKNKRKKLNDMSALLNKASLKDIFSGRQSHAFAVIKTGFIERTFKFVHEIAANMNNMRSDPQTVSNPAADKYLCYILNGEERSITTNEVLDLYVKAHRFGLPYLVRECTAYMNQYIEGEYLIDMLLYAEIIYDENFLKEMNLVFVKCYNDIQKSTRFQMLLNQKSFLTRLTVDSVVRTLSVKGGFERAMDLKEDKDLNEAMDLKKLLNLIQKFQELLSVKDYDTEADAAKGSNTKQESLELRVPYIFLHEPPVVQQEGSEEKSKSPRGGASRQKTSKGKGAKRESIRGRSSKLETSKGKDISCTSAEEKISSQDSAEGKNSRKESGERNIAKLESTEENAGQKSTEDMSWGQKGTASKTSDREFTERKGSSSKYSEEISALGKTSSAQELPEDPQKGESSGEESS